MTLHVSGLPGSLDPLIAEAKRRARARRLLLLGAAAVVIGGGAAATVAFRSSARPLPPIVAAPTCRDAQLSLVPGRGGVAAGTYMSDLALVNVSAATCELRGWPGVRLVLGNGRMVAPRVHRDHYGANMKAPARTILVRPGAAASFRIAESDGTGTGMQTCFRVKTVLITPPGASEPLSLRHGPVDYCAPYTLYEVPIVSGRVDDHVGF
jgi:Protein of unknown function (DUF4232)